MEAQLYPRLKRDVLFRPYGHHDHDACLAIYRQNEADRFPRGYTEEFSKYLRGDAAIIVAEMDHRVVGYGGIRINDSNIALLSFGIVAPEFQGQRIGTTLTLLRISQLASYGCSFLIYIAALNASLPFYRQFGFRESQKWKAKDGQEHPLARVRVSDASIQKIGRTLSRRGVEVRGHLALPVSGDLSCITEEVSSGGWRFKCQTTVHSDSDPGTVGSHP